VGTVTLMSTPPFDADTPGVLVLPHGPRRGEYFEVDITGLDVDGHGVGHTRAIVGPQRAPKTWRWSLRGCVPGDRVSVDAGGAHGTHAWGRVSGLLVASPNRVPAPCAHYAADPGDPRGCGGCTLQALPLALQHEHKRSLVERFFRQHRLLRDTVVLPVLADTDAWRYRNKMEFSFGTDCNKHFALGLHPGGFRHEVFSLRDCHLISEAGGAITAAIAAALAELGIQPWHERTNTGWLRSLTVREGRRSGERLIELTTADVDTVAFGDSEITPDEAAGLLRTDR
jgi:23S rRNA (uracil1939-C5)-methyltransferase